MLFDSHSSDVVRLAYQRAMLEANQARRDDASKALDFYSGRQVEYIRENLAKHFSKPERLEPYFVNLVRKIVNQLAMVYVRDAKRTIDGTERDEGIFSEIAASSFLGGKMKLANRLSRLLGVVLLRPVWRNGAMDLDVLTPDLVDAVTGDAPHTLEVVTVTHYGSHHEETEYSVWTKDAFRRLNFRGHVIEEEPNPYGVIPFVPVWSSLPTDSFWTPGALDLVVLQEAFNERLTDLCHTLRHQSFGVGYVKGVSSEVGQVDPGTFFSLPSDGEVGFARTNAPIRETLECLEFLLKQAAVSNGLPASSLSTDPTEESGVARIAANRELDEQRRDDLELFRVYEHRLFELSRTVWNAHNPARRFSEGATLQVDFAEVKESTSPDKQVDTWDRMIAMGIASPVDVIMERNPDLSRDNAKARLIEIQDENREFSQQI